MTDPVGLLIQGVGRARAERLPLTWLPRRSGEWALRGRLEVLRQALRTVGAVAAALFWLVGVALLVQGLVSWWAELESFSANTGVPPAWDFYRALE
jgi:hypothetical protein